jgi:hypothetical protein
MILHGIRFESIHTPVCARRRVGTVCKFWIIVGQTMAPILPAPKRLWYTAGPTPFSEININGFPRLQRPLVLGAGSDAPATNQGLGLVFHYNQLTMERSDAIDRDPAQPVPNRRIRKRSLNPASPPPQRVQAPHPHTNGQRQSQYFSVDCRQQVARVLLVSRYQKYRTLLIKGFCV